MWEFQHPDFVRGREDLLENVKRKIPAKKKPNTKVASSTANRDDSPSMPAPMMDAHAKMGESDADLRMQVAHLTALQDQMQNHVLALTKQYQGVIGDDADVSEEHGAARSLMQNLIQYLMNLEQDRGWTWVRISRRRLALCLRLARVAAVTVGVGGRSSLLLRALTRTPLEDAVHEQPPASSRRRLRLATAASKRQRCRPDRNRLGLSDLQRTGSNTHQHRLVDTHVQHDDCSVDRGAPVA